MAIIKNVGKAVLGLAVLIGSIGKFAPHLFFDLPFPLSVILWVTTGHSMPMYFTPDAWKEDEIDSWMKDGDLVVATGVKSGTTFMLYCTHQIRTKGTDLDDELFPDVSLATPWPDLMQSRTSTWAEQKDRYNDTVLSDGRHWGEYWNNPAFPFRIFKSHYAPPELPVRKKGGKKIKYLAMARNGIDVAASMTNFYSAHTDEFRKLWGGFPPNIPGEDHAADEPPAAVKDMLPTGPMAEVYFGYVKKWWEYRNDPNVLLMHYTDVRKDLKGHVSKIAKFLDVDLNENELDIVTKRCSIEHMKTLPDKFGYKMPLNRDKGLWDAEKDIIVKTGAMVNTGQVGKGKAKFHPKVVEQWKQAEEDMFGHNPEMLNWARNGGKY
mmetsp:Transcript_11687/g.17902  ORF Transcript_11687/g.17902 Transcript_11687/m.17902 type:complete len:378 (+) Transcript_11687:80-1213(+)|eukprot:CAMPEP_0201730338 /NCGR_PEP_ID=MMETSP0593-20130828/21793_1 /ASSEMBLY_ACC=CAM_ASM_000672 /TAXON_ID=267983 /ORGANISM="Skeletonema japonicum, Strain CCMP2506" /LENGTH=377 /DNA_ID=CAMNT_0048222853 /DNA_START=62 /DNA_END=1195 /DNA_ORIENTATION=+